MKKFLLALALSAAAFAPTAVPAAADGYIYRHRIGIRFAQLNVMPDALPPPAVPSCSDSSESAQVTFSGQPGDSDTVAIAGTTYEFDWNGMTAPGNVAVTIGGSLTMTLVNLESAVGDPRVTIGGGALQVQQAAGGAALTVSPSSSSITSAAFTLPVCN